MPSRFLIDRKSKPYDLLFDIIHLRVMTLPTTEALSIKKGTTLLTRTRQTKLKMRCSRVPMSRIYQRPQDGGQRHRIFGTVLPFVFTPESAQQYSQAAPSLGSMRFSVCRLSECASQLAGIALRRGGIVCRESYRHDSRNVCDARHAMPALVG